MVPFPNEIEEVINVTSIQRGKYQDDLGGEHEKEIVSETSTEAEMVKMVQFQINREWRTSSMETLHVGRSRTHRSILILMVLRTVEQTEEMIEVQRKFSDLRAIEESFLKFAEGRPFNHTPGVNGVVWCMTVKVSWKSNDFH